MAFERSDDPVIALQQAVTLFAVDGSDVTANQVTAVADAFLVWLRRPVSIALVLVAVEEADTGEPVPFSPPGESMAVVLDTSQQARFDINSRDDRGFLSKAVLDMTVTGENINAEIVETPDVNTPNQLRVWAVQPGAGGLVVLSVPDNDTIADASEAFDVVAGGIESLALGTPAIEEQPPVLP